LRLWAEPFFFSLVIPLVLEINDLSTLSSGSGWVLAAVPMALISSMLIRELGFRLQFRATTKMALVLLYAIAAFAPSWLSTAIVLNSIGGGQRWLEAYVSFLAYASVFSGFAWIVANTDWCSSRCDAGEAIDSKYVGR